MASGGGAGWVCLARCGCGWDGMGRVYENSLNYGCT